MAVMDTRKLYLSYLPRILAILLLSGLYLFQISECIDDAKIRESLETKNTRYLLYEVNPGEGFNLRRDVYMRVANLVKVLIEVENWVLVLPPWGRIYHWHSEDRKIPWSAFFDVPSLALHVPVIEFEDYLKVNGPEIEEVYYLQRYKDGFQNGKWEEKMDISECLDETGFKQTKSGDWDSWFWDYEDVRATKFQCLSIQAQSTSLKTFLTKETHAKSIGIFRAEQLIHGSFSEWSPQFWTARRSMVFSKDLRAIGDKFRAKHLMSNDKDDKTVWEENWKDMKREHGDALGGPYVAVHLRRRDFLYSHKKDVPSLADAALQLRVLMAANNISALFVATDAPDQEFTDFKKEVGSDYNIYRYIPSTKVVKYLSPGAIAIIDQWICAHARIFIGTSHSTFSLRIHEEREILGFDPETTFNCLCQDPKTKVTCDQPSRWMVKYV